jgi:hypothetical protein
MEPGGSFDRPEIVVRRRGLGIRRLTGPVRARILDDPASYEQFANFRCGDPETSRSAREVNLTARRLGAGEAALPHVPVVVEDESGELVAFCTIYRCPQRHLVAEAYITAMGRSEEFRGSYLRDGVTTPGMIALIAGLDMVAIAWQGRPMPQVWARVLRGNKRSHDDPQTPAVASDQRHNHRALGGSAPGSRRSDGVR